MMGAFVQLNNDSLFAKSKPIGYVVQESGCWEWVGSTDQKGYGMVMFGGRTHRAHRWHFERTVQVVPSGLELDHLCRNPRCIRPDHLEIVTPTENKLRGTSWVAVNAQKQTCPQGHPLAGENLVACYVRRGRRYCRTCANEQHRRKRAAQPKVPRQPPTHCQRGHEFARENLDNHQLARGVRLCVQCRHARQRAYRERKRGGALTVRHPEP